ncbi:MAG TPA: VacJ family lipoprotein [Alphaproteobacteria bacterium]
MYLGFQLVSKFKNTAATLALVLVLSTGLAGCATGPKATASGDEVVSDPLKPFNSAMLSFNEILDKIFFNPINTAYRVIVPEPGRQAIHNVLENLKSPVYLANELLQGDFKGAGLVVKRFAINTFAGFGGLMDTAASNGMPYQPEDFGQTLAVWGVGSGPYIVWPILGPSTLRDSVGFVGDIAMDPLYWYAANNDKKALSYIRAGLTLIDTKDRTRNMLEDLRRNSGDYYTALQSVYMQRRNALINDMEPGRQSLPDIE